MIVHRSPFHRIHGLARRLAVLAATIAGTVTGLALDADPLAAQGGLGYCASELGEPVVYVTLIFDTKLNPKVSIEAGSIAREFHEYLKGRFGYKNSGNFPVQCAVQASVAEAEAHKGRVLALVPPASKQVEVDWKYQPDSAWVAASMVFVRDQGGYGSAPPRKPADFGYCISQPADGPISVSAAFDGKPQVNLALWEIAFSKYLGPKTGFIGTVSCRNGSREEAQRLLNARADGARAAGRTVVETGWRYDAAATTAPAPKPDDDPEPAAATGPPPPPPAAARDFATKEMPDVRALCQNDRMVSGAFDCTMVSRVVYNYRLAHWSAGSSPEPLAQLFAGDKLDCTQCVKPFAAAWAASRAQSGGYALAPAQCVGKRFEASIKAEPSLNRVKEFLDAAMKACPK